MKRLTLTAGLLLALFLTACGATPSTLSTMTPVPRTPRATATNTLTPTPTGTPLPTPTPIAAGAGTWWVQLSSSGPCDYAYAITPSVHLTEADGFVLQGVYRLCTASPGLSLRVGLGTMADGFGPTNLIIYDGTAITATSSCNGNCCTTQADYEGCRWVPPGTTGKVASLTAGAQDLCGPSGGPALDLALDLDVTADCQPASINPTPTPAAGCAITEIYTRYGVTCQDYNLRGGCGADDEYIEVACTPTQSLAGWQLAATDVLTYTIESDNMTGPLKVFWLDQWPTWTISSTLPLTGTATLINAAGSTVDTRSWQTIPGYAWAAQWWTYPAGFWWYYPPSPGR